MPSRFFMTDFLVLQLAIFSREAFAAVRALETCLDVKRDDVTRNARCLHATLASRPQTTNDFKTLRMERVDAAQVCGDAGFVARDRCIAIRSIT